MAWVDTLLEASFRGLTFDIVSVEDVLDRATAEHTYPYVDGADLEDMGAGPRRIAVEAVFWGDDYESQLQDFLDTLSDSGDGELIHPVFGYIEHAQFKRYSIRHQADDVDHATVRLEFEEATPASLFFYRTLPSQRVDAIGGFGDSAVFAAVTVLGNIAAALQALNPLALLSGLRLAMSGPVQALQLAVAGVALSGLDVVNFPRAWAADVSALVGGLLDMQDLTVGPMPAWRRTENQLAVFDTYTGGTAVPGPWLPGAQPSEAQAVAVVQATLQVAAAAAHADAATLVLAAEVDTPTLAPADIEIVTNAARTRSEAAITQARATFPLETARAIAEPLRSQALALQEAARAIIEARPPLLSRAVDAPGNFRLIAHWWYGDHTRAAELFRLNPLRLPNFIQAGDRIDAYSR